MAETQKPRRKGRNRKGYVHRKNAVHITFYSPSGDTVPKQVIDELERLALAVAIDNNLLIGTATT